jgi:hypothetical protein
MTTIDPPSRPTDRSVRPECNAPLQVRQCVADTPGMYMAMPMPVGLFAQRPGRWCRDEGVELHLPCRPTSLRPDQRAGLADESAATPAGWHKMWALAHPLAHCRRPRRRGPARRDAQHAPSAATGNEGRLACQRSSLFGAADAIRGHRQIRLPLHPFAYRGRVAVLMPGIPPLAQIML